MQACFFHADEPLRSRNPLQKTSSIKPGSCLSGNKIFCSRSRHGKNKNRSTVDICEHFSFFRTAAIGQKGRLWTATGLILSCCLYFAGFTAPAHAFSRADLKKLLETKRCAECDLSGADLTKAKLKNAYLERADLSRANLEKADLEGANLKAAKLSGANLKDADLEDADLYLADLTGAILKDANLKNASLDGSNFSDANLAEASYTPPPPPKAETKPVPTNQARETKTETAIREEPLEPDSENAALETSGPEPATAGELSPKSGDAGKKIMATDQQQGTAAVPAPHEHPTPQPRQQIIEKKKAPATDIERLLTTNACVKCDLSGADLSNARLDRADLSGANLAGADLNGAYLRIAELNEANLSGANLAGAHLAGADLYKADLSNARLDAIELDGAYLVGTLLEKPPKKRPAAIETAPEPANPGADDRGSRKAQPIMETEGTAASLPATAESTVAETSAAASQQPASRRKAGEEKQAGVVEEDLLKDREDIGNRATPTPVVSQTTPTPKPHRQARGKKPAEPKKKPLTALERLLTTNRCVECDLAGADLKDGKLKKAQLERADLTGANLKDANLSGANLKAAKLSGANLEKADLENADLYLADLSGANLKDADLSGASLAGADLTGADLTGADLKNVEK